MVVKLTRAMFFTAILAAAQEPAQVPTPQVRTQAPTEAPNQEPIRVQTKEVIVPVTVRTAKGEFVTGMEKSDFTIYDQGKPQTITYFSGVPNQPVVVGFLLDLSSASRSQWKSIQEAAIELVFTLIPGDKVHAGYLIGFGNQAELMVDTTYDPEKIVAKIRKLSPSGGSSMNDAVFMASSTQRKTLLGEPYDPRRVVVVIGDGHDNSSTHTLQEALELAQRNLVTVYCMDTEYYSFDNQYRGNLRLLADDTGGKMEEPLQNVYKDVSGFLTQPRDEGNYQLKPGTGAYTAQIAKALDRAIVSIAG